MYLIDLRIVKTIRLMHDFLFFKVGRSYTKIKLTDILYIQAEKRYVSIVTQRKSYSSTVCIGQMEKLLPTDLFCRIHRSYIISLNHTDSFDHELAYIGNRKIPIAEQYLNVLRNAIVVVHGNCGTFLFGESGDKLLNDLNS